MKTIAHSISMEETIMKKVIFDIDGVLLSEERYFDVSALTVWEILYSLAYMGLPGERDDFNAGRITEGQIAGCRSVVWGNDTLLSWLKARGINSNWDMVHADLITILWLMAENAVFYKIQGSCTSCGSSVLSSLSCISSNVPGISA